ncbi:MAG: transporter substrate-binding protein, partial [Roseiarcus sp.]
MSLTRRTFLYASGAALGGATALGGAPALEGAAALGGATALGGALAMGSTPAMAATGETIKIGILHSLSGTMAISETTLKDVMLMLIDEQNKKGGVLGKKLEAVVVDPASNWPLFAEKAKELIEKDK